MLRLSELFYSLQGEGITAGVPAVFVRTAGCNFRCGESETAKWKCDTWNIMSQTKMTLSPEEVLREILHIMPTRFLTTKGQGLSIVFTGGEPALQIGEIVETVKLIRQLLPDVTTEIETNGSKDIPVDQFDFINVSPKLSSSGVPASSRLQYQILGNLLDRSRKFTTLKFVVAVESDLKEIDDIISKIDTFPTNRKSLLDHIFLMPAMETKAEGDLIRQDVWKWAMDRGWRLSLRSHIEVFDKKAGV